MAILTEIQEEKESAIKYDVFLSFRGKDTRLGFTDYLYQALLIQTINTFLDEEEVETGEELKPELARAIKSSRASIIVLSKNYASSTWCLDELVMILEQRKASNHIVLPVFYNVEPTHVRKQESTFGDALIEHKRRIEAETDQEKKSEGARKLKLWTEALTEVADLKGKDTNGCREMVVIEEIVKEISTRLDLHLRRKIPDLIGMGHSINAISSWLKDPQSESAEILTICGISGIGKTSLAKYIYSLHCHEFERSSFLEDIERKCAEQTSALLELQKQLLRNILKKRTIHGHDVDVCTSMIEVALFDKQTFVILDGVNNFKQLDVLIGTKGLCPGTKIIVTTKDGSVTEKCSLLKIEFPPKHTKHALKPLSDTESLNLLCWHAFRDHDPKEGYEKEAQRVAGYCGGHPLTLEVLGSSLINEDLAIWSDVLEMLEAKGFCTDVQKVLQITVDSLPGKCKELFMHIACFFVGTNRGVTEMMLKYCGFQTSYGITKLIDRCLLTIGERNELRMHQLLQDLGRDLVSQESPGKPWKQSRVWNHEESLHLLQKGKGTKKIQALILDMKLLGTKQLQTLSSLQDHTFKDDDPPKSFRAIQLIQWIYMFFLRMWSFCTCLFLMYTSSDRQKVELRTNEFEKMSNLSLLQLNHVNLCGSYSNFPKGLKWLRMHGFKLKYIPSELPMEKLVALDMSYSNLEQLWKKPKLLVSLKYLNLSYSKLVRVGGFSGLPALERLILTRCECLVHVSESIGECERLVLLDLSCCIKLKNLPSNISKLKNLKVLSLDNIFTKPHASSSAIVESLPKCLKTFLISLPASLVTLSLIDNNLFNESFPMDFSSMPMLKILYLDKNPIDSLPDCVRNLRRLELLSFTGCRKLKSVLCPPRTIIHLDTDECESLVKITFPQEMSASPYVNYQHAVSLTEVQGIIKIQATAEIDEEILCSLGWTNLQYMKDLKVQISDAYIWSSIKKLPVHMFYEFGIFSTCFPGKAVPDWLAHKSNGSSLSFTMPSSSMNKRIQGINICFVHAFTGAGVFSSLRIKVRNETKKQSWVYYGYMFAVQEADEDIVWLSHWMFGNNEIENGDEVSVTIVEEEEDGGVLVRECAISPMYDDRDNERDPLSYYKSWKHIIGRDLSAFQLTSGDYFLIHDRFSRHHNSFKDLFDHKTTKKLLGYTPQYKRDAINHTHDF